MSNKVLITNEQNAVKVPSGLRILIRRSCNAVLEYENFDGPAEISVTFVDNARIHELNKQYRDKDAPTDVLSFPMAENGEYDTGIWFSPRRIAVDRRSILAAFSS